MIDKIHAHLDLNFPFLKGKKLLLAISGGIDSMVMIHILKSLGYTISIAHCNFGLRGEESIDDEKFVAGYAHANNIPYFVIRFDTQRFADDAKLSVQLAARQLRYAWFKELLEQKNLDYLVTAHHLDDSLETFLINFSRGTGLEGLTGIPQQNGNIVRPLLPFTRNEIEAYATVNNITWREDSSNTSDKYLRNKLRHDVVPVLKKLNPSFMQSFALTITHLQEVQSLAEDAAILIYKQVVTEKEGGKEFDIAQLKRLPNYKAYLYQWLRPFGFTAWNDVYSLPDAQSGKQVFSRNFRLLKDREALILEPLKQQDDKTYEITSWQHEIHIPLGLRLRPVDKVLKNSGSREVYLDADKLKFPLFVRKWKEGDYFYPAGMKGQRKKVSKYFKDEKLSLSQKENTWLLCSGNEIAWVIGKRADNRFTANETTTQIIQIEVL